MKLVSQVGTSEVTLNRSYREGDVLIVVGKMGVWESRIYVSRNDFPSLLKLIFAGSTAGLVLKWIAQLTWNSMRKKGTRS